MADQSCKHLHATACLHLMLFSCPFQPFVTRLFDASDMLPADSSRIAHVTTTKSVFLGFKSIFLTPRVTTLIVYRGCECCQDASERIAVLQLNGASVDCSGVDKLLFSTTGTYRPITWSLL